MKKDKTKKISYKASRNTKCLNDWCLEGDDGEDKKIERKDRRSR